MLFDLISFISILLCYSQMQSCVHIQSSVIPRLGKEVVLQKSSYEDSVVCAFLYAYVCVCIRVYVVFSVPLRD